MRFAVLGSGSRGNSALVSSSDTRILIDCGFPLREIIKRLARLGLSPAQLDAILVTHEHADHIHGVELLARHYQIPVYLSAGTLSGMRRPVHPAELLRAGQRLAIRGLEVQVVGVSHDAREPTQFVLSDGQRRLACSPIWEWPRPRCWSAIVRWMLWWSRPTTTARCLPVARIPIFSRPA